MALHRSRALLPLVLIGALLCQRAGAARSQDRPFVVSSSPSGEVSQIQDANEIRVVFADPMVGLGGPVTTAPPWLTITPTIRANYYWSGTRTLIVTVDPDSPLPYASRYDVSIGASAKTTAGRQIPAPYSFTFTTPTVRLLGADWYRKNTLAGDPAVIALRFNQPVRPQDVLAHATVAYGPHAWTTPEISARARDRLKRDDPAGLAAFDAKVARINAIASSSARVEVALSTSWDEKRFPRAPELVVLETTSAPSTDGWLRISVDDRMPSAEGRESSPAQSTTIRLEPTLFVETIRCTSGCAPTGSGIGLRRQVSPEATAAAVSIRDLTDPRAARDVARVASGPISPYPFQFVRMTAIGYPDQPPASTWAIRVDASLKSNDGQVLGYPWLEIIDTIHAVPYMEWPGQVWEAKSGPVVPVTSRNFLEVHERAVAVAPDDLLSRLQALRPPVVQSWPAANTTARKFSVTPDTFEAHGFDYRQVLPSRGTGLLWAAIDNPDVLPGSVPLPANAPYFRSTVLQVTNLGLTVKDSPSSTLIFVTRLDSAQPVAGANVVIRTPNGVAWRGTTGADGVAMAPAMSLRPLSNYSQQLPFVVTAEKDDDVAFAAADWTGDVAPNQFGLRFGLEESLEVFRGSIFTDRGVYMRGEQVKLKAMFRGDSPDGMRLFPDGTRVTMITRDQQGRVFDQRTIPLNRWSSADWSIDVPPDIALGTCFVDATVEGNALAQSRTVHVNASFLVAAFRRPDFRVDTAATAESPVLGGAISATADAKYLFGAPVGRQPVRWYATRSVIQSIPDAIQKKFDRQIAFGYMPTDRQSFGNVLNSNDTLDVQGHGRVETATTSGDDFAWQYRFGAEVVSASGQRIANQSTIVMHPASLYVGVSRPPFFVDVRTGFTTSVVAANLDGTARANVPVTVSLWREQWQAERAPQSPGTVTWTRKELPAGKWSVTTAAAAVRQPLSFTTGGSYILRAEAVDDRGRPTRTDVRFYAIGGGVSSWRSNGNRIDLTPERTVWAPGETARVLVQSPWPRAIALVTKEREGVKTYKQVDIRSTQDTVDIPITEADVPNVYVSVVVIKGRTSDPPTDVDEDPGKPSFRVGYTELTVSDASKRLKVEVKADRDTYRPHDQVNVSVAVKDRSDRDRPSEVTLWAVDYGLLSLTDFDVPDVAQRIYARKQLQVQTEDNRIRLIGKRKVVTEQAISTFGAAGGRGGGAGAGLGLGQGQIQMAEGLADSIVVRASTVVPLPASRPNQGEEFRADFRPLVFWLGSTVTGADGRATTTVTLPDSLTTYRIMAVAGDLDSHFGAAATEIRATKALTLLPSFPRFLSRDDRASFGAIVTNSTGRAGDAVVTIASVDPSVVDFTESRQTVRLDAGQSQNVRFGGIARAIGQARVRMTVTLGDERDAFEMPLPVTAPLRLETVAAYGDTLDRATEKLSVPAGVLRDRGGLTVSLASTALVGLGESAVYLENYPYECAEQKASKALALLLSADLGGAFAMREVKPGEMRDAGIRTLNDLFSYQCGDGGFGYFPGECYGPSSMYLTAYVLDVMHRAGALNVKSPSEPIQRAVNFLSSQLRQPPPEAQWWPAWAASQAYAVKVLAEFGRDQNTEVTRLYGMADRMPVFALSYLADAMAARSERGPRYAEVLRRMTNALRVDADRAFVQEVDDAALVWLWNSNVRATAVVLDGLSRRKDADTFVAPLVRWLLAARENGRWGTTQENAVALGALVNYYKTFEADVPNMTAGVSLAGRTLGTATFAGRSTTAQQVTLAMSDLVGQVGNETTRDLVLSRTGTGRLYYTARMQFVAPQSPAATVDRGIRIDRRYQRYTPEALADPATTFANGDLVRVTLTINLPHEGRFLAFTDPLPAGFEAVDGTLKTTAFDLAAVSTTQSSGTDRFAWWRRGGFDHVEKHDDKVIAFATRLAAGRHEFTYLVRATTSGTFSVAGASGEAMYAPEITGRSAGTSVTIR